MICSLPNGVWFQIASYLPIRDLVLVPDPEAVPTPDGGSFVSAQVFGKDNFGTFEPPYITPETYCLKHHLPMLAKRTAETKAKSSNEAFSSCDDKRTSPQNRPISPIVSGGLCFFTCLRLRKLFCSVHAGIAPNLLVGYGDAHKPPRVLSLRPSELADALPTFEFFWNRLEQIEEEILYSSFADPSASEAGHSGPIRKCLFFDWARTIAAIYTRGGSCSLPTGRSFQLLGSGLLIDAILDPEAYLFGPQFPICVKRNEEIQNLNNAPKCASKLEEWLRPQLVANSSATATPFPENSVVAAPSDDSVATKILECYDPAFETTSMRRRNWLQVLLPSSSGQVARDRPSTIPADIHHQQAALLRSSYTTTGSSGITANIILDGLRSGRGELDSSTVVAMLPMLKDATSALCSESDCMLALVKALWNHTVNSLIVIAQSDVEYWVSGSGNPRAKLCVEGWSRLEGSWKSAMRTFNDKDNSMKCPRGLYTSFDELCELPSRRTTRGGNDNTLGPPFTYRTMSSTRPVRTVAGGLNDNSIIATTIELLHNAPVMQEVAKSSLQVDKASAAASAELNRLIDNCSARSESKRSSQSTAAMGQKSKPHRTVYYNRAGEALYDDDDEIGVAADLEDVGTLFKDASSGNSSGTGKSAAFLESAAGAINVMAQSRSHPMFAMKDKCHFEVLVTHHSGEQAEMGRSAPTLQTQSHIYCVFTDSQFLPLNSLAQVGEGDSSTVGMIPGDSAAPVEERLDAADRIAANDRRDIRDAALWLVPPTRQEPPEEGGDHQHSTPTAMQRTLNPTAKAALFSYYQRRVRQLAAGSKGCLNNFLLQMVLNNLPTIDMRRKCSGGGDCGGTFTFNVEGFLTSPQFHQIATQAIGACRLLTLQKAKQPGEGSHRNAHQSSRSRNRLLDVSADGDSSQADLLVLENSASAVAHLHSSILSQHEGFQLDQAALGRWAYSEAEVPLAGSQQWATSFTRLLFNSHHTSSQDFPHQTASSRSSLAFLKALIISTAHISIDLISFAMSELRSDSSTSDAYSKGLVHYLCGVLQVVIEETRGNDMVLPSSSSAATTITSTNQSVVAPMVAESQWLRTHSIAALQRCLSEPAIIATEWAIHVLLKPDKDGGDDSAATNLPIQQRIQVLKKLTPRLLQMIREADVVAEARYLPSTS